MATATAPIVVRDVLRVRKPLDKFSFIRYMGSWRLGPTTPDGYWIVTRDRKTTAGTPCTWAVRVVVDPTSDYADLTHDIADDALYGRVQRLAGEDDYLRSLEIVRMVEPDDLTRIRDAVLAGHTGGPADGAPRKRTRKAATR